MVPQLKDLAPVLTAVSTIEPFTQFMCGLIILSTVESMNREPSVEVGTISRDIRILKDVALASGLNLKLLEPQSALNA